MSYRSVTCFVRFFAGASHLGQALSPLPDIFKYFGGFLGGFMRIVFGASYRVNYMFNLAKFNIAKFSYLTFPCD